MASWPLEEAEAEVRGEKNVFGRPKGHSSESWRWMCTMVSETQEKQCERRKGERADSIKERSVRRKERRNTKVEMGGN